MAPKGYLPLYNSSILPVQHSSSIHYSKSLIHHHSLLSVPCMARTHEWTLFVLKETLIACANIHLYTLHPYSLFIRLSLSSSQKSRSRQSCFPVYLNGHITEFHPRIHCYDTDQRLFRLTSEKAMKSSAQHVLHQATAQGLQTIFDLAGLFWNLPHLTVSKPTLYLSRRLLNGSAWVK